MHATPPEFPNLPPGDKARSPAFAYAAGAQPVPGFTLKRGLGHGGFGEVYYAVSDAGKEVALKLVRRNLDVELRGATQCLNLKHPNLIGLYDVRTDAEGNFWIVMEYVAGERLSDALDRFPHGMPEAEALAWFRGIAAGTTYLHHSGIVHRDLKPANIFIENGIVKIGDYGLSKFISVSRRSGQTESVGTVHYMAPEISGGRYGKQIDIYALGILLYELLTGRVPFDGESIGEILMKHLTAEPDLSALAEPYRSAVGAALQKDPDRRPRDVEELLRRVEGEPVESPIDVAAAATSAVAPNLAADRAPVSAPVAVAAASGPSPSRQSPIDNRRKMLGLVGGLAAVGALLLLSVWIIIRNSNGHVVARIQVPEGSSVAVVDDSARPTATRPAEVKQQPDASATAPVTWGRMPVLLLVATTLILCSLGIWGIRRHADLRGGGATRASPPIMLGIATAVALVVCFFFAISLTTDEVVSGTVATETDVGNTSPQQSIVARSEAPTPHWVNFTTLGLALAAVVCVVVVWQRRRWPHRAGTNLAETELPASSSAASIDHPVRKALLDSTGGWLAATIGSLVVVRLLLLFRSQPMKLPEFLWGAATTATGTALMIALLIPLRRRLIEPANRRLLAAIVGLATGMAAWFFAGHLGFTPGFDFSMEGVSPQSWPECYDAGKPLLPAYLIYFGATFFLVDWWSMVSPSHAGGLHLADAFAALFWAGLVHLIFPFPQAWGFLVIAGCALVLPWSMPMSKKKNA